jgi:hypothetical protein
MSSDAKYEIRPKTGGAYKIENQFLGLTYDAGEFWDKEALIDWIKSYFRIQHSHTSAPPKWSKLIRVAWEIAPTTGMKHNHVFCDLGKAFKRSITDELDYKGIHPNIVCLRTPDHRKNWIKYLGKADEANIDLLESKDNVADYIGACDTMQDALRLAPRFTDVGGVIQLFRHMHVTPLRRVAVPFKGWQTELHTELQGPGDDRKLIVIFDTIGQNGKSQFIRQCYREDKQKYLAITALQSSYHAATVIQGALNRGWTGDTVLLNLTKSRDTQGIYGWIEEIRDGFMTALKYEGAPVDFDCFHFVMFANWLPDFDAVMPDRWDIRELVRDEAGLSNMVRLNLNVARQRKALMAKPDLGHNFNYGSF